jgi:hypothetical protein
MLWYIKWFVLSLKGSYRRKVSLVVSSSCMRSLSSARSTLDVVASAAAVVGTTRGVASVVAAAAGTSLTVTGAVVLLLDDDSVAVTVVSVNEQGKKLERYQ